MSRFLYAGSGMRHEPRNVNGWRIPEKFESGRCRVASSAMYGQSPDLGSLLIWVGGGINFLT